MSEIAKVSLGFKRATYAHIILTFFLIILGGYVKALGAGLACPDWPLCYGKFFPFFDGVEYPFTPLMIFVEWFHRLVATSLGFYMIIIVIKARKYRFDYRIIYTLSLIGLFLFITQGLWGAITVIGLLEPLVVVAHLGNAILILFVEMLIAFYATIHSGNFLNN